MVPASQLGGLTFDRVVVPLDPDQGANPGQQLGLVERLVDEVVGAGLDSTDLRVFGGRPHTHPFRASGCPAERYLGAPCSARPELPLQRTRWPRGIPLATAPPRAAGRLAPDHPRRVRAGPVSLGPHLLIWEEAANLIGKCANTDRLLHVPIEAGIQGPFPVLLHRLSRHRDHGYVRCPRVLAQPAKSLHAVHTGQLEIHQNEIGRLFDRQGDAVLARPGHTHVVACVLKHVPQQLEIPLVILDDQDYVGHPDSDAGDWRLVLAQRRSPARPDRLNSVLRATYVIRPCSRSLSCWVIDLDVRMTTGTDFVSGSARSASTTSKPSIPGMRRSSRTAEGCRSRISASPSWPVAAPSTVHPSVSRFARTSSMARGSSSTATTVCFRSGIAAARWRAAIS